MEECGIFSGKRMISKQSMSGPARAFTIRCHRSNAAAACIVVALVLVASVVSLAAGLWWTVRRASNELSSVRRRSGPMDELSDPMDTAAGLATAADDQKSQ